MQGSLAQEASRKVQASFLPDLLYSRPAVPFKQAPPDESSGAFVGSVNTGMTDDSPALIVEGEFQGGSSCFLCAWSRRKALKSST
jgi:hypothetical protein